MGIMVSTRKAFVLILFAAFMAVCVQFQIADTESFLNAETQIDFNLDYDQDGETTDAGPVDELVKLPVLILFMEAALLFIIFLLRKQRRVQIFNPLMILSDFIFFLLRPPANQSSIY